MYTSSNTVSSHPDQGMTVSDIKATQRIAKQRNEIIIFRNTGCWSRPHIEWEHPTKPFAIKGKSSDWGPHAGFVPYEGEFSKEFTTAGMQLSTQRNEEALRRGAGIRVPTYIRAKLIHTYFLKVRSSESRRAVDRIETPRPGVMYFFCTKPGSAAQNIPARQYVFMAKEIAAGVYELFTLPTSAVGLPVNLIKHEERDARPLLSMSVPGSCLALTGDYDLFAICPSWGAYGNRDVKMDRTLDDAIIARSVARTEQKALAGDPVAARSKRILDRLRENDREDPHMGNVTPRIREAVIQLQAAMGGKHPRVHHNAESGRPFAPPASDGFPLTVIQPHNRIPNCTFDSAMICDVNSLRRYFSYLYHGGYYPPRNQSWGMRAVW